MTTTDHPVWDQQPALIPHPKPEVPCRLAKPGETPRAAAAAQRVAVENGWSFATTYARGTTTGRKPRVVDSIAVRMWRERNGAGQRAVAVWIDGKRDCSYTSANGWPTRATAAELKEWLAS